MQSLRIAVQRRRGCPLHANATQAVFGAGPLGSAVILVGPRALVLLGATAAQSLLGRDFRVTRGRERALESELAELVTATINPSAVLRGKDRDELDAGLVEDLRVVSRAFAG